MRNSGLRSFFFAALPLVGFTTVAIAESFQQVGEATTVSAQRSLLAELAGNTSGTRLAELESALQPMYAALPKGAGGYLGHQPVRYALHRLLLQRHGWFVVGLEPNEEASPPYLRGDWVPEYLQGLLEKRLGSRGIDLQEIAALAAALEDLVHAETADRVDQVYRLLQLPTWQISGQEADRLLETYMMIYLSAGNFSMPMEGLEGVAAYFKHSYADWAAVTSWRAAVVGSRVRHAGSSGLDRAAVVSMANELGERFGAFNDGECRSLKAELLSMEGQRAGRVPLVDFYKKGLYSHWNFNEKMEYLRALGALDESDPAWPSVIVPNYLSSRPNCLVASTLYSVCCRNECEDLMAHLELEIAEPTASPHTIRWLIVNLPADALATPPVLSETLVQRLHEIAARHGGEVPLHGRLFSQWMHHAFPRECPYPHEGSNPQTPDEWMREAGEGGDSRASEEEVRRFLRNCTAVGACANRALEGAIGKGRELPWNDAEKLLVGTAPVRSHISPVLRAIFAGVLIAAVAGTGLFCGLVSTAGVRKPSASIAGRPWQVALLIFAVGVPLEAMGLLDRTAFAWTFGVGLAFVAVLPLLFNKPSPRGSKESCV